MALRTSPVRALMPARELPSACAVRTREMSSAASKPAFSAMMVGSCRSARAKASMATCFLPGVLRASSSTAAAIKICGE
jgi:hypothetical protein